jgi:hypothetical protein
MSATDEHHLAGEPLLSPVPAEGPSPADRGVRASDAEREAVVARLHHALGEGRLDLAETDMRVAAAYAARYRSDLSPLLADLPDSAAVWISLVWRSRLTLLGPGRSAETPPTPAQCRTAAALVAAAVVWVMICALLGAALVH